MAMEAETFEQVVVAYGAKLRARVARQNASFRFDEDEVMQECLIRIWRACSSDREVDSPAAYAEQLVASVLIDLARRRAAQRSEPLEDVHEAPGLDPAQRAEVAAQVAEVQDMLQRLEDRRRRAAELLLQGYAVPEIATQMALTEGAARNLAYRGLNELRERLGVSAAAG